MFVSRKFYDSSYLINKFMICSHRHINVLYINSISIKFKVLDFNCSWKCNNKNIFDFMFLKNCIFGLSISDIKYLFFKIELFYRIFLNRFFFFDSKLIFALTIMFILVFDSGKRSKRLWSILPNK